MRCCFNARPKEWLPTGAARDMAPHISRTLNEISHIPEDLTAQAGVIQGTVHVGALPLCRSLLLPRALVQLIKAHPLVKVVTNESAFSTLVTDLRSGDVDVILGALRHDEESVDTVNQPLFSEELVLVVRAQHALAHQTLKCEDLTEIEWILPR